jgi:hypothetical protein
MVESSDFTLYTSHKLPVVQTKPIPSEGRGAIAQNEPNFGELVGWAQVAAAQTNPICHPAARKTIAGRGPWRCHPARGNCAKQTQFPATPGGSGPKGRGTRGEICKTNPIRGHAARDEAWGRGAMAPNKPNLGERSGRGQGAHGTNKANSPPAGYPTIPSFLYSPDPDCAKQTQFAATPRETGPGDGGQTCETNPISGGWSAGPRGRCTNKPNSPPSGQEDRRRPEALAMPRRQEQLRQTNPIPGYGGGTGRGVDHAKQSQFPCLWIQDHGQSLPPRRRGMPVPRQASGDARPTRRAVRHRAVGDSQGGGNAVCWPDTPGPLEWPVRARRGVTSRH